MSVYTIETRANPGQLTRHIEGDVIPADAYTESFPANAPIRSFKNRAVPRGLGRMPGFVISGLLGFEVDKLWFSYFSEDPDVALTILQAANNHAKSRMMTVASYFERDRKIDIPDSHVLRIRGFKILTPYQGFNPTTAIIMPLGS